MMDTIKILFFAQTRDRLKCNELDYPLAEDFSVAELKLHLQQKNKIWQDVFQGELLCAVNQELVSSEKKIHRGDEVAFFPPVTGG